MRGTSSEWYSEWYNEWQQVTMNDKWQQVTMSGTMNDNEWQQVTTSDKEWQWVTISANFSFFLSNKGGAYN